MSQCLETPRLYLNPFALSDADELFQCITPAVARFMKWDPPSAQEFPSICESAARAHERGGMQFVIRRRDSNECLGLCGVARLDDELPEMGIWMKTSAHGQGYGREAVATLLAWSSRASGCSAFSYPVAVENIASRWIAEGLGGKIVATRTGRKYNSVVYQIPALRA
jgi:RimJ/RimL family protein N-acetyltransferase